MPYNTDQYCWKLTLLIQWALSSGRPVRSPLRHCQKMNNLGDKLRKGRGSACKTHFSNGDFGFLTTWFIHSVHTIDRAADTYLEMIVNTTCQFHTTHARMIVARHVYVYTELVMVVTCVSKYNNYYYGTGRFQDGRTQV